LEGLTSYERADFWRGANLSLLEAAIQPLPEGEFYWREIIGLRARLLDGRDVGRVEEVWPTGSNDVLVVRDGAHQYLVPALRELLVRVDLPAGEIWLDPPAGLIEDGA
jgi:16S rRNA processing protein RimM